jgi:hypothetical protein
VTGYVVAAAVAGAGVIQFLVAVIREARGRSESSPGA